MAEQLLLFGGSEPIAHTRKQTISSIVELLKSRPAPDPRSPIVWSYSGGVDSTAGIIACYIKGIRPDLIVFSDTGDEKQETYDYIKMFSRWLKSVGFPPVTRTRYIAQSTGERKKILAYCSRKWKTLKMATLEAWLVAYQNARQVIRYSTLMEKAILLNTLPSKAFGYGECSKTWKIDPNRRLVKKWLQRKDFNFEIEVRCFIGINADEQSRLLDKKGELRPLVETDRGMILRNEYPLIEWGLNKENEKALIAGMGLPVPPKSSCKRCPNMTPEEVLALSREDYLLGCFMEKNAEPFLGKIKGLGRGFSWRDLESATPLELLAWQNRQESRQCGCVD